MGKPYDHQAKDESFVQPYENLSVMNHNPLNGNHKRHSNLSFEDVEMEMEFHDNYNSAKRPDLNKIPMVPTNKLKSNSYIKSEQTFNKKSSNLDGLDLNVSPPDNDKSDEPYIQGDSSSSALQKSHHSLTTKSQLGHGSNLVLMGCRFCYLYVMVCDVNLKCPKCFRGDHLMNLVEYFNVSLI